MSQRYSSHISLIVVFLYTLNRCILGTWHIYELINLIWKLEIGNARESLWIPLQISKLFLQFISPSSFSVTSDIQRQPQRWFFGGDKVL